MRLRHVSFLILLVLVALVRGHAALAAPSTLAENPGQPQTASPHVALLLPLDSPALRTPAEAVRRGFAAAAAHDGDAPPFLVYATSGDPNDIITAYGRALAAGARLVVGPLTRNGVTALAASGRVTVPTLSLAMPDREGLPLPPALYLFGLSAEDEAHQVAQMAWQDGKRQPALVVADTPLARRIQAAFAQSWQALGGSLGPQLRFTPGHESAMRGFVPAAGVDMIVLAAGAAEARAVRPYLPPTLPVYATSQAFGGQLQDPRNVDLVGVRFIDMPWLLAPDHPAVMIYPRPETAMNVELARLYALGIDAQRLARLLMQNPPPPGFSLDGVTGRITLDADQVFRRQGLAAEFQQDTVVVLEGPQP